MTLVYGIGAFMALLFLLPVGAPLVGFNTKTLIGLVSLAIFPTILGHATLIRSLSFFKASTVSALTLIEPVFAGVVAWMAYGEALKNFTFLGYAFILIGQILLIYSPFLEATLKKEIELS
jgi:drug/metabolite transporter (DMT)-like permease